MEKIKIYIVDDDDSIRFLLKETLEMEKYKVFAFSSGEEALGAIGKEKEESLPALLLTDFKMPGMNGEILVGKFKEELPNIPVIIMSGDCEKLKKGNADAFFSKPFDLPLLMDTIERLIK